MSLFEQATRGKLRFSTDRGVLTVEQLWDMPLQSKTNFDLDTIAKGVNRELKAVGEESFVATSTNPAAGVLTLKLDVLKHIIGVKMNENKIAAERSARTEERQKLLGILDKKQDAALEELTPEQIRERLAKLET